MVAVLDASTASVAWMERSAMQARSPPLGEMTLGRAHVSPQEAGRAKAPQLFP